MDSDHVFTVHYRDEELSAAVRAYVVRAVFHRTRALASAALVLLLGCVVFLFVTGDRSWSFGLLLGLLLALALVLVTAYVTHLRFMRAKVGRMAQPQAKVTFAADSVTFEADSGATTLPWRAFKDIWDCGTCWLLMLAPNQFLTLPKRDVPAPALAFAQSKIIVSPL